MSNTEFNWFTELDNAIKAEPTDERCKYLSDMAGSWVTCPCGELCKALPRDICGRPEDWKLVEFGYGLANSIRNKNWTWALVILNLIEKRTIELLK